jgi:hypothetical protein
LSFRALIFSALFCHLDTDLVDLFVKPNRKNVPLSKSSKKSYIWSWLRSVFEQAPLRIVARRSFLGNVVSDGVKICGQQGTEWRRMHKKRFKAQILYTPTENRL